LTKPAVLSTVAAIFDPLTHTSKWQVAVGLLLLTVGALAIHGYHPYAEDAEIYLPGIEKNLHPELFPVGAEFFESHAGLTLFPNLIAASVRLTHLPFDYALFGWHLGAIFLLLLACWELSGKCFATTNARWCAVALVAALLTLPVAGTALYLMDQYLNPRNLAAFAGVFAIVRTLEQKYVRAGMWLVFAVAVHPLMTSFALSFCILLVALRKFENAFTMAVALLPFGISLAPPSAAYHEAVRFHISHYILQWQWYEWMGIVAPVALYLWFRRVARSRGLNELALMCRALIFYELAYFAAALIVSVPKRFESLARIQPLRSLHLLYILLFLFCGGFIAEYVLKKHAWRWVLFFLPLAGGMAFAQRALFPASSHIEWPWGVQRNQWAEAFTWIGQNTPTEAVFAIDPLYFEIPGEDTIGFRALAQRSRLADAAKDSGAVSMFPPLAEKWFDQYQAEKDWRKFSAQDFSRLNQRYGVTWIVLQTPGVPGLTCPYQNSSVLVCHLGPPRIF